MEVNKEKKKKYDRLRYNKIKNKEWFVKYKGNYYLRNRDRLLKESKAKAKRIPKAQISKIIDYWSSGFIGYDRHKDLFVFARRDIEKLKEMVNNSFSEFALKQTNDSLGGKDE